MAALPGAVLFACDHNAVRSPIAEAIMKHAHGKRVYVDSVGVRAGPLDPFAVAVMEEAGLNVTAHRPKSFEDLADQSFDLIITLSPQSHHRALEMTRTMACEVEYWPTYEPGMFEGNRDAKIAGYRQIRDQIEARIYTRFPPSTAPTV